jgi:hypothetical protein
MNVFFQIIEVTLDTDNITQVLRKDSALMAAKSLIHHFSTRFRLNITFSRIKV